MNHCMTVAACAALALGASVARADEFDFSLVGAGIAQISDPVGCDRHFCDPNVSATWDGSVRIKLDGTGDGVYGSAAIQSFAVESNWQSYTWLNGDPGLFNDNSVTVHNGVVTDIEFNWVIDASHFEAFQVWTYPASASGSPLFSAFASGNCSGCGRPDATGYQFPWGTLIPIPEPATAGLLLAGLGLLVAGLRRRV